MKILIAEDDPVSRRILERLLHDWNYEVVVTVDGSQAWSALQHPDAPSLAILDIMMPEIDGLEICRRVRRLTNLNPYLILLTAKAEAGEIVSGIDAGADDYLVKPYNRDELRVRINVGVRTLELQTSLARRLRELELALAHVKQLQGILPICSYCKNVRDDSDYWQTVETYLSSHSDAQFSHGICPTCYENIVVPQLNARGPAISEQSKNAGDRELV